jgi:protein-disulfide isomerase
MEMNEAAGTANSLKWAGVVIAAIAVVVVVVMMIPDPMQGKRMSDVAEDLKLAAADAQSEASNAIPAAAMSEKFLGDPNAPVTMIEYASLTCPHCARFHNEVLPKIKRDYIDTGQVKLIYRDYPLDQFALKASLLARCAPNGHFFTFLHALFKAQELWARSGDPEAELSKIGRLGGIGEERFAVCTSDQRLIDYVLQQRIDAKEEYSIASTPSFIINGRKLKGALSFEMFQSVIESVLE